MSKSAKLESALRVAGTVALFVGLALMIVGCTVGAQLSASGSQYASGLSRGNGSRGI